MGAEAFQTEVFEVGKRHEYGNILLTYCDEAAFEVVVRAVWGESRG